MEFEELPFRDRYQAGRVLAKRLAGYAGKPDVLVLGLPRGGVPVAAEVARELSAPLDVFLVRKLGVPGQEELAMGAIANGGIQVLNPSVVDAFLIPPALIEAAARRERREIERRQKLYRRDKPPPRIEGRTILLVDDGLATGSTVRAAIAALRQQSPSKLVVAVPVASPDVCADIGRLVDEMVCEATPEPFWAVGQFYEDFSPTTDDEVRALLEQADRRRAIVA
jgi:putative phosphoribosyl transferase